MRFAEGVRLLTWILTKVFYFLFNHDLWYPGWLASWEERSAYRATFSREVRARARRVALTKVVKR